MRASLLLLAPLLACGSSSSSPRTPSNTAPSPIARATLAEDVAALGRATDPAVTAPWVQRATFLGWTATDQAAFRLLICAVDPLGGRGDYCDLEVCVAARAAGQQVPEPSCESAASLSLSEGEQAFDAAATTAAAEAAVAKLGALADGTAGPVDDAGLAIERGTLVLARGGGPRLVVHAPMDDQDDEMSAPATGVAVDYVGASPDGACRVVLGRLTYRGWYEGVTGDIPRGFAAVTCD